MSNRIHIIINPASGQPEPVLNVLNRVFRAASVNWDIALTHQRGDARRYAELAANQGVDLVAAYGGDGTIMEAAMGLVGSQVPLAILPGGTANLLSVALGIPGNLEAAAKLVVNPASVIRWVDIGQIGETHFLLRVSLGLGAPKAQKMDRKLKDRFGILAYSIAALGALSEDNQAIYRLTLDDKQEEVVGFGCLVDNTGNIGIPGVSQVSDTSISDGVLDVLVVKSTAISAILTTGMRITDQVATQEIFYHWQARHIHIEVDPPQSVQVDGISANPTPVDIRVLPQAIAVLVTGNKL